MYCAIFMSFLVDYKLTVCVYHYQNVITLMETLGNTLRYWVN